jgi:prepilin peptidase CpaA
MGRLELILGAALVAVAVTGAVTDLRSRRIPNWLTVTGLLAALLIRALWGGGPALQSGLLAAGVAFAASFPFFVLRALGGGDVKFLVAVCAFLGWERLGVGLAAIAIAGGALALVVAIRQGALQRTLALVWSLLRTLALKAALRSQAPPLQTLTTPGALTVPYGLAIAVGAVVGFYW